MTLPQAPYSSHVREEILRRVAAGERLRAVCAEAGAPCCESVTSWARREPEGFGAALRAAYAQGAWRRRHGCDPEAARACPGGCRQVRAVHPLRRFRNSITQG